jgi:hypothetical protein
MPITFQENVKSGGGSIGSNVRVVKEFTAFGSSSKSDIETALLANTTLAPATFTDTVWGIGTFNYIRDQLETEPMEIPGADGAPNVWTCRLTYVLIQFSLQPRNTGDTQYSFSIGTQSINLKRAISTVSSYKVGGGSAPSDGNLIGWDGQKINGVNIDVPTFSFQMTCWMANSAVSSSYIAGCYAVLISPINNASFAGFDTGEVKFVGMSGTRRGRAGDWEITFLFAVSPNVTGLSIGDTDTGQITGIAKKGWEYLDITYKTKDLTVSGSKYRVSAVQFARVRKVYNTSAFSALGTGL